MVRCVVKLQKNANILTLSKERSFAITEKYLYALLLEFVLGNERFTKFSWKKVQIRLAFFLILGYDIAVSTQEH